jgi:hypothetical protein
LQSFFETGECWLIESPADLLDHAVAELFKNIPAKFAGFRILFDKF